MEISASGLNVCLTCDGFYPSIEIRDRIAGIIVCSSLAV